MTQKQLVNKLDEIFRELFRLKYEPICCICGKKADWYHPINNEYGIQVGHYISRNSKILRWDFRNVAPQCTICNSLHNDDKEPFKQYMIRNFGIERIEFLESEKRKTLNKSILFDIYNSLEKDLQNFKKL